MIEYGRAKSLIQKNSVVINGHKTSVSCEPAFWSELKVEAKRRDLTIDKLVAIIDGERDNANLSSSIRLFVLKCV